MKFHELKSTKSKSSKRVGRGIAAGQGKTAGRGTKGQGARTGSSRKPGFEGGQNPLMQRLPKLRGFNSHKVTPEVIYTGQLDALKVKTVNNTNLAEAGLVTSANVAVKLINKGEITKTVNVSLQSASLSAIDAIQKAGGSFTQVDRVARPKKQSKNERLGKK